MMPDNERYPNASDLARHLKTAVYDGRITPEQFRERLKTDAERPIDLDMLRTFCDAYEDRLEAYGNMWGTIVEIATDQRDPNSWQRREHEVDKHIDSMMAKLPLWKEQMMTVSDFLSELRANSRQGPVRLKEYSHASAHRLADHIFRLTANLWQANKETAHRSRTDSRYMYATTASRLFYDTQMHELPKANDLLALMELERAAAVAALQGRKTPDPHKNDVADAIARRRAGRGSGEDSENDRADRTPGDDVGLDNVFQKCGDVWTLAFQGESTNLRDTRGLEYIHRLIEERSHGNEKGIHVLSLVAATIVPDTVPKQPGTDAGPVMDLRGRVEAEARIKEIDREMQDGSLCPAKVAEWKDERTWLERELKKATGLGGRERKLDDRVERARVNATKCIKAAMGKIEKKHPRLWNHLQDSIKTGTTCRYNPRQLPPWQL